AGKSMPLDHTFEAATFGYADRIHVVPRSEKRGANHISGFDLFREIAELPDAFHGRAIEFLDVTQQRFGDALLFLVVEAELHGIVSVALLRFALQNAIGTREHDRDGANHAFGVIDPRLAQFFS